MTKSLQKFEFIRIVFPKNVSLNILMIVIEYTENRVNIVMTMFILYSYV